MGVREAFFKARWGKWGHKVGDQLVCESLIGWWWGKRAVSQGLALSIVRRQWVWGICAQGHLVVNFFHLVGSFSICKTTQEMYIRFCYLAYFRDELKILWLPCGWFTVSFLTGSYGSTVIFVWREGSVLGMPLRFYSVTILYIYIYIYMKVLMTQKMHTSPWYQKSEGLRGPHAVSQQNYPEKRWQLLSFEFLLFLKNICLFGCAGLSCDMRDLQSLLWHVECLVVACKLFVAAYGI